MSSALARAHSLRYSLRSTTGDFASLPLVPVPRHVVPIWYSTDTSLQAYELSTLTGTQVLLLVVSETGLVYTFTTAKLQPLVTQPEGKNLIQACLNAPAGQIPTGAPLGQAGSSVHQANIHSQPQVAQSGGPVPVTHPASGVAQGMPPPTAMPPPTRNIPGGINIGGNKRDDDMEDDDEDEGESPSDDPTSPMVDLGPGTTIFNLASPLV